jgi:general secretion pathway protein D
MRGRRQVVRAILLILTALLLAGCAARWAYRQGQTAGKKGDWDLAVARLTKAVDRSPTSVKYRLALDQARAQASRQHFEKGKKHLGVEELERALEEFEIAARFDPSNHLAAEQARMTQERIAQRDEERQQRDEFAQRREVAQAARFPTPVLSPRSQAPIHLKFQEASLRKVLDTLGQLAGVNILYEPDFRDKNVTINVSGVTFEEALDQLMLMNKLFYKVVDSNTLLVVTDNVQKRRAYEDVVVQTFYLDYGDPTELANTVRQLTGIRKAYANKTLGAVTVLGPVDNVALAARIVAANDKPLGEVIVEVQILEVRRTELRKYGIELSNYDAKVTFDPIGTSASGYVAARAHLLSSLNLSDFVVQLPSDLFVRFLKTDETVRLLASPRLRAAEGKKTSLKIGTKVPIPQTTYTSYGYGGGTAGSPYVPITSFQYVDVGVEMDITPKVNASGEIALEFKASFSLLGADRKVGEGQYIPEILSRAIEGVLRVRDGESSIIGGLIQGREARSFSGLLGLQHIPILNQIISPSTKNDEETEILISLTPRLVRGPQVADHEMRPLHVGTETDLRIKGARPPLIGPLESEVETAALSPEEAPPPSEAPEVRSTPSPEAPEAQAPPPMETPPSAPIAEETPAPSATDEKPQVMLAPPQLRIQTGAVGRLSVVVLRARDLVGVDLAMVYDGAMLEATDVGPSALLTLDGSAVGTERALERSRLRLSLTRASGTSGSGAVAAVSFRGFQPGTSVIRLKAFDVITTEGRITLAPPVPVRVEVMP